ncbi:MAG: polysaccharide deacetylase family protein [Bacteroidales bacterium]|nr:polysaccharide deacetylase family protein [Bacteroidales bacterium]MBN2757357.1 polysaccharide deacetylase family protein [Bacteroidales bacterium]
MKIAKWQGNKKAAILLQFDDSTPGQAQLGVPALNSRNFVGTWYVNPGRDAFISNINTWENIAPEGGQELANHTMTHTGANTYEEVVYEVGEASKIIWKIRGDENFGSLIAFNRGGGTTWDEEDLANVLDEYYNIDRLSYIGIRLIALSVPAGSNANEMYEIIPLAIQDSIIGSLHFHGISAEDGDPPMDWGNAGVWIYEFEKLLDKLEDIKNDIWICGYIQVYKYIKEKDSATIAIEQNSENKYTVALTSETDPKYFNEELTIVASIPGIWKSCTVTQNNKTENYSLSNGILIFNALPNKGDIVIEKKL